MLPRNTFLERSPINFCLFRRKWCLRLTELFILALELSCTFKVLQLKFYAIWDYAKISLAIPNRTLRRITVHYATLIWKWPKWDFVISLIEQNNVMTLGRQTKPNYFICESICLSYDNVAGNCKKEFCISANNDSYIEV